ncbi:MAG TPA: multiheme c-type cytochrome [Vicinamibacteria bacterium]|nr:multiheme c-type cytochrome [Vicinamibacteria bacterium]
MLTSRTVLVVGALILAAASVAPAQTVVGPSKCTTCHDHDRQTAKWQKEEPAQYKDKAHYNTRKQLDGAKAGTYAKAIGIADPYDVKGSCVTCHATVFRGDANAGVSCESCHGPASGYLEPHQVKGSYAKAVATGLRDLKSKPPAIAKACVACHLTTDKRLTAAGHPSGAEFDVGAGLKKVVHWDTAYDFAVVTAAGKAAMGPAAARAAAAPPPAPGGAAPAAPGGAPPPVKAGGRAPAAAPAAPSAASAPWDWNAPIRALPEDYKPEPAEPAEPAATVAPAGTAAPAAPRPTRPAPAPPRVAPAPSLAEDLPVAPAIVATEAAALAPPPAAAPPAGPRSATARIAEARGGAALVLARVLRGGAKVALPPATPPKEFKGPDGELLRLQDEAIALALEALRRP